MVDKTVGAFGRLDYAANNAGVGPDGVRLPIVDIDGYVVFLCSDKAFYITGHAIPIDGGMTLMPNDG